MALNRQTGSLASHQSLFDLSQLKSKRTVIFELKDYYFDNNNKFGDNDMKATDKRKLKLKSRR